MKKIVLCILASAFVFTSKSQVPKSSFGISPIRIINNSNGNLVGGKVILQSTFYTNTLGHTNYNYDYLKSTPTLFFSTRLYRDISIRAQYQYAYLNISRTFTSVTNHQVMETSKSKRHQLAIGIDSDMKLGEKTFFYTYLEYAIIRASYYSKYEIEGQDDNIYNYNAPEDGINLGLGFRYQFSTKWSVSYEAAVSHFFNPAYIARLSANYHF